MNDEIILLYKTYPDAMADGTSLGLSRHVLNRLRHKRHCSIALWPMEVVVAGTTTSI